MHSWTTLTIIVAAAFGGYMQTLISWSPAQELGVYEFSSSRVVHEPLSDASPLEFYLTIYL